MKRLALTAFLLATACGGNYSNEDLDFHAALPVEDEITAVVPQALVVADSAEYYQHTRAVGAVLTGVADALLDLIDAIRSHAPTTRAQNTRVWGPFADDKKPGWRTRMLISREPAPRPTDPPLRFTYQLDVARTSSDVWITIVEGSYSPRGGARLGEGRVILNVTAARAAGYPVDDLGQIATFTATYQNLVSPRTVSLRLTNVPVGDKTPVASYERTPDGGSFVMDVPPEQPNLVIEWFRLQSRWRATGEGRGDLTITHGRGAGNGGVDCWGADTRATYSKRSFGDTPIVGAESACVFAAP